MERVRVGGVTIDRCAGCGAMWFDRHELQIVLSTGDGAVSLDIGVQGRASWGQALGGMVCPYDASELRRIADPDQPHVLMDWCPTCAGVLLDRGELADLSEVTLRERLAGLFRRR